MNQKTATVILVLSAIFSGWLYWGSDVKIEQILTSREWQTNMNTFIVSDQADDAIGPLSKVHITSNVKYLPNGDYLRESRMQLFNENKEVSLTMSISETGRWELSDNYLLIDPKEFKDSSTADSQDFTDTQLRMIKQVFITDAQQSRRVDIVNDNSILLTSLGHGSRVLVSTP
ncbi:transmembrane regulatory protein toxS [Vibrio ishigakensis]|uniref:Transmembrane regulatory protein toxS n=2 Tax=Vibrio ishigakensis TaxID=1481914 RepID=A0A0B8NUA6_9VIBR|nr:regulatory protein ToxS [Vibrio ishigakensis]GAM57431.1 transmembrane regulatory protein toxS [Vibrio ishigakensis]